MDGAEVENLGLGGGIDDGYGDVHLLICSITMRHLPLKSSGGSLTSLSLNPTA